MSVATPICSPGELLRRGVVGSERRPGQVGQLAPVALLEQLGDAEVEQPDLALRRHQHVGGLEVAVHHQTPMRVRHRGQDLEEQLQPRADPEPRLSRMHVDGTALHVLEREVRLAAGCDARVQQPGDVGMREGGEDLPLALQPLPERRRQPGHTRELEGHRPARHHVGPLGEPHRAHPPSPSRRISR